MGAALDRGNRKAVTASVDALALPPGGAVADVGFGGGVGLALLLERADPTTTVHGVEVSGEMLARAARRFGEPIAARRLVLHRASMTDLPFAPGSLDGVVTTNTIYFVEDLDRAFAELAGALKPSGRAVVGMGDPAAMAKMPVAPHGFRIRSVAEVADALGRAGLRVSGQRRIERGRFDFHVLIADRDGTPAA